MRSELTCTAILLLCAGFAGCGDALVGETFLGSPLFRVEGAVQRAEVGREPTDHGEVRLSLFWIGFDRPDEARDVVEQRTDLDPALGGFEMAAFDIPPEDALAFDGGAPGGDEVAVGFALLVLYADGNANAQLNAGGDSSGPDVLLGASASHVVVYADGPVDIGSPAGEITGAIDAGYHLFENAGGHVCPFSATRGCAGRGVVVEVDPTQANVVLTLYDRPEQVVVPSPDVPGDGTSSGTDEDPPGNLYDGQSARRD